MSMLPHTPLFLLTTEPHRTFQKGVPDSSTSPIFFFAILFSAMRKGFQADMGDGFNRNYRIEDLLGFGQFGAVHRCVSVSTGEAFAVKTIDKLSAHFNRRLINLEIKLTRLAASGNSRAVQIHHVYEDDDAIHLILDLCPGPDLFARIEMHGPFYESEAAALIIELAESIAECHRRGIVHRDIKPENILFDSNGRLILADFGSAASFEKGSRALKGRVGTPAYMAPEVIAGRDYDEKVDVWGAGVVLYMMLGRTLPFTGSYDEEIFSAVNKGDPICFPEELFRWSSPAAEDLMTKMLARDPETRLSAEQVLKHPWITAMTLRQGHGDNSAEHL